LLRLQVAATRFSGGLVPGGAKLLVVGPDMSFRSLLGATNYQT
jgi:hypothetical protein